MLHSSSFIRASTRQNLMYQENFSTLEKSLKEKRKIDVIFSLSNSNDIKHTHQRKEDVRRQNIFSSLQCYSPFTQRFSSLGFIIHFCQSTSSTAVELFIGDVQHLKGRMIVKLQCFLKDQIYNFHVFSVQCHHAAARRVLSIRK